MAIIRSKNTSEYFILSNKTAQDGEIQMASLGLLTYMLSKPVDWIFYTSELAKHFENDSKYSVDKAIKDLKEHGYLIIEQKRGKNGKFGTKDWTVLDKSTFPPKTDIPSAVTPSTVSPSAVNRQLQNTDTTKNRDVQSTEGTMSSKLDHASERVEIINYLNAKTNKRYKPNAAKTKSLINARLKDGFTVDEFKRAIDNKVNDWLNDTKMNRFLRPDTLFTGKLDSYLNETSTNDIDRGYEDGATW